jgi:5-methylcytosine-specific restriction enzyme subunit McrC
MDDVELLGSAPSITHTDGLINRLNERFLPLLHLARLFLTRQSQLLTPGGETGFAFLFDMSQLFESFVTRFMMRRRMEILPSALADCELLPQAHGATLYLAQGETKAVGLLKPDLLLRTPGQQFPLIADMKYKRLRHYETAQSISRDDLFQMHAYAQRYNCERVLMLYPQTVDLGSPILEKLTLLGGNQVVTVATLDVRGDLWKPEQQQQLVDRLKIALA